VSKVGGGGLGATRAEGFLGLVFLLVCAWSGEEKVESVRSNQMAEWEIVLLVIAVLFVALERMTKLPVHIVGETGFESKEDIVGCGM
jgi:hypothetical protein